MGVRGARRSSGACARAQAHAPPAQRTVHTRAPPPARAHPRPRTAPPAARHVVEALAPYTEENGGPLRVTQARGADCARRAVWGAGGQAPAKVSDAAPAARRARRRGPPTARRPVSFLPTPPRAQIAFVEGRSNVMVEYPGTGGGVVSLVGAHMVGGLWGPGRKWAGFGGPPGAPGGAAACAWSQQRLRQAAAAGAASRRPPPPGGGRPSHPLPTHPLRPAPGRGDRKPRELVLRPLQAHAGRRQAAGAGVE
jgi:hypothetical protein